jgi:hypothetical protein
VIAVLNNVATTDRYTEATTVISPQAQRLRLRVRNASIYRQLGRGAGGAIDWEDEVFVPAGADDSLDQEAEPFDAARFRSATPNTPARITAEARL